MADFQQYEADLRAEHDRLTQAFEAQQVIAEQEWAKLEAAKAPLAEFRKKYGRVLKALDAGAVTVEG